MARGFRLSSELVAGVLVGAVIGWGIDRLLSTSPFGLIVFFLLGFVAGIWILTHLFMLPKDAEGYRTWVYFGLALAPLALACAIAVW